MPSLSTFSQPTAPAATSNDVLEQYLVDREPDTSPDVGMILENLSTSLKTLSNEIGEIVGNLLGGLLEGVLESIQDDIEDLLEDIEGTGKELLTHAADELEDVIDYTVDRLEGSARELANRVMHLTMLVDAILSQNLDGINQNVLVWLYEANITAYDAAAGLPFASDKPRLVYVRPLWIRRGQDLGNVTLIVRGNFLNKFDRFFISGQQVTPQGSANEQRFRLPDAVRKQIENQPELRQIDITAQDEVALIADIFGGRDRRETLFVPVLEKLDLAMSVVIWPVFDEIHEESMIATHSWGKTDDDSRSVKRIHQVPKSGARFIRFEKIGRIDRNRETKWKGGKITGGGTTFTARCYLEGDGGWPMEGGAWCKYRYRLYYRWREDDVVGNVERYQLPDAEDFDEQQLRIVRRFQYTTPIDRKLHRNIRWHYKILMKVMDWAHSDGPRVVEEVEVTDERHTDPRLAASIDHLGHLSVEIDAERFIATIGGN